MSRAAYYLHRGRTMCGCWACDKARCKCRTRDAKRGARNLWRSRELPLEVEEAADLIVWASLHPESMCGYCWDNGTREMDSCSGEEVAEWLGYLRSLEVYPPPVTGVPVLEVTA